MSDRTATGAVGARVGPYLLEEMIGAGGMSEVWRAVDTDHPDRRVAVKLLRDDLGRRPEFVERLRREARTAAGLSHPNVVPIHRYGEADGRPYLVMPLLDGVDLGDLLHRGGPLPPQRAVAIVGQVAEALDAAHAHGLVHRDVKPGNVRVVGPRDVAYLLDLGIARPVSAVEANQPAVDVYALAATLYACLTGQLPDATEDAGTLPPPQPSIEHGAHLAPFDAVIARGMATDPRQRPASAGVLAAEATAALHAVTTPRVGRSVPHPASSGWADPTGPATTLTTPPPAGPRRRAVVTALVALAAVVVIALVVGLR